MALKAGVGRTLKFVSLCRGLNYVDLSLHLMLPAAGPPTLQEAEWSWRPAQPRIGKIGNLLSTGVLRRQLPCFHSSDGKAFLEAGRTFVMKKFRARSRSLCKDPCVATLYLNTTTHVQSHRHKHTYTDLKGNVGINSRNHNKQS